MSEYEDMKNEFYEMRQSRSHDSFVSQRDMFEGRWFASVRRGIPHWYMKLY